MNPTVQSKRAFEPSVYQTAVFDWVNDPNPKSRFALISAVAGSGKSTTLIEAAKYIDASQKILFVAFMSKNVADLKPKLPFNAEAKTLNSVGNGAWIRHLGGVKPEIVGSLNYRLIGEWIDHKTGALSTEAKRDITNAYRESFGVGHGLDLFRKYLDGNFDEQVMPIAKLIALAKGHGIVPRLLVEKYGDIFFSLMEDKVDNWKGLVETYDVDVDQLSVAIYIARRVMLRSVEISKEEIDYDSQLWLPIIHKARFWQYDWVMADEVQDQNAIQNAILQRVIKPGGRGIFVGDQFQSIYMFRGALSSGMETIRQLFNAKDFPLSICYRCAKNIVTHAAEIVPHIEFHESSIDGQVLHAAEYGPKCFDKHDLVLCRNNAPLIDLAHSLIRAKIPCRVLGREIESGLTRLVKKCAGKRGSQDIDAMLGKLDAFEARELDKIKDKRDQSQIDRVKDKCETIKIFARELPEHQRTVRRLIENIEAMFKPKVDETKQVVSLSTIHKAKGSEYDNVYILYRDKRARGMSKEAQQQEKNILYVARTRAKKCLTYLPCDGYSVDYAETKPRYGEAAA